MKTDLYYIHPEDATNVNYWAQKWGVRPKELYDAIIDTGSLSIAHVRTHLRRSYWFRHPIRWALRLFGAGGAA
jgi:hypothetical protein